MTNHEKCYLRDRGIIEYLDTYGAMDVNQLKCRFFTSLRMAQRRLCVLSRKNDIKRDFHAQSLYYYTTKKPESNQIAHRLGANWCRLHIENHIPNGSRLFNWVYEPNFVKIRPDAMYVIKDEWNKGNDKEYEVYCIEVDLSPNPFDKVKKYNYWYETLVGDEWFLKYAKRFPMINIVTYDEVRELKIQEHIRNENKHGLRFTTKTLDMIKKECMKHV